MNARDVPAVRDAFATTLESLRDRGMVLGSVSQGHLWLLVETAFTAGKADLLVSFEKAYGHHKQAMP